MVCGLYDRLATDGERNLVVSLLRILTAPNRARVLIRRSGDGFQVDPDAVPILTTPSAAPKGGPVRRSPCRPEPRRRLIGEGG